MVEVSKRPIIKFCNESHVQLYQNIVAFVEGVPFCKKNLKIINEFGLNYFGFHQYFKKFFITWNNGIVILSSVVFINKGVPPTPPMPKTTEVLTSSIGRESTNL